MGRKFPAEHLRREEVLALLEACGRSDTGLRNRALITSMWRSGLRLGEALALEWKDVDPEARTIRVLHGKGDHARTTGTDPQAFQVLEDWRARREELAKNWSGDPRGRPLFCTLRGGPIGQSYVRSMLPRLARRAGVERRVHAHIFRHTFAVDLLRRGVNIVNIQRLLGHSSLATTATYLASLSPEEALDAVRNAEW